MARRRRFEDINPGDTLYVYNLDMMFLEKCPIAMVNSGADAHHIELTYEVAPFIPRKIQATYNARAFTQKNKLYAVDSEAVKDALPRILNKRLELLNKERKQLVSQTEKAHCTSVQLDSTLYPEQTWEDEPTEYTLVKTTEDETLDVVSDTVFGHIDALKKLINEEVRKAYAEGYVAGLAAAKH